MRTINGKSIQEVMAELRKPFECYVVDYDSHPVIPYELIRERADEVLGLNYSVDVELVHREIEGEHHISCKATVSIFDDAGVLVSKRTHVRADFHERFNKDHKYMPLKLVTKGDEFSSMTSLAIKKAFTMFGLGNQFALDNARKSAIHKSQAAAEQGEGQTGERKLKAFLTLVNKQEDKDGELYSFQNSEGKVIAFTVKDRSKVANYKDLGALTVGGSICLYFYSQSRELIGVTKEIS